MIAGADGRQRAALVLVPALFAYCFFAYRYSFFQDDAFISFRFVANFLNGHGLVFNAGEYVEGYTNPGWVIYLSALGALGIDFPSAAKITGWVMGVVYIWIGFLIARRVLGPSNTLAIWLSVLLVGCNQSLAYWSPAGLETAAFAVTSLGALYAFMTRSWMLIFYAALAVWLRPDGAVIVGILIVIESVQRQKWPGYTVACSVVALLISLPLVGFKLYYYGSLLPNPFYAKTTMSLEQLANGLEYTVRFFGHYGFWGIPILLLMIFWKDMGREMRTLWLFCVLYTAYVMLIGGDVLKVHRFFLPIIAPIAVLSAFALSTLVRYFLPRQRRIAFLAGVSITLILTTYLPTDFVTAYNETERAFTRKMEANARHLLSTDSSTFSVASPTVGVFGYELIGHDVIDMLGLTDSAVARHKVSPISGLTSTWKEPKRYSSYILQRSPDYVVFSTGLKPSAPSEKELLLYQQFLESYRALSANAAQDTARESETKFTYFKRVRPVTGHIRRTHPIEYVDLYKEGIEREAAGDFRGALNNFNRAVRLSPQPLNLELVFELAYCHLKLGNSDTTQLLVQAILATDSFFAEAHNLLYLSRSLSGDSVSSRLHRRWIQALTPWSLEELDSTIAVRARTN